MTAPETTTSVPVLEMFDVTLAPARDDAAAGVAGIHWCVQPGDYWVAGGLHGGGKSDLLATAAGLQRPSSGSHWLFGRNTAELDEDEFLRARLRVGMVFADGGRLFNDLTVVENVALPLRYHEDCDTGNAAERAHAVLDWAGVADLSRKRAGQISRGSRQRVALARALALKPELLLLDNPLAGLDPRQIRWWLDSLTALQAGHALLGGRPMTLVIAADDLRPWATQARQFALLKHNGWMLVGGRAELAASTEPLLRELLMEEVEGGS